LHVAELSAESDDREDNIQPDRTKHPDGKLRSQLICQPSWTSASNKASNVTAAVLLTATE